MNLGDLGVSSRPAEAFDEITFGWFGRDLRAHPDLIELDYVDFMNVAGSAEATDGLIKDFARTCVHPEDFDVFWSLARTNKQQINDIYGACRKIVEAVAERPTGRSSDSSDGPLTTPRSSGADDFSAAMAANAGRPDRQLALVRAHGEQVRATA